MDVLLLIDPIVRQTTVLIAQLATASRVRAPLSHVAGQVFFDLTKELRAQGLGNKVIADMFGMALRTYRERDTGRAKGGGKGSNRSLNSLCVQRGGVPTD